MSSTDPIEALREDLEAEVARLDKRITAVGRRVAKRRPAPDPDEQAQWVRIITTVATLVAALGAFLTPILVVLLKG